MVRDTGIVARSSFGSVVANPTPPSRTLAGRSNGPDLAAFRRWTPQLDGGVGGGDGGRPTHRSLCIARMIATASGSLCGHSAHHPNVQRHERVPHLVSLPAAGLPASWAVHGMTQLSPPLRPSRWRHLCGLRFGACIYDVFVCWTRTHDFLVGFGAAYYHVPGTAGHCVLYSGTRGKERIRSAFALYAIVFSRMRFRSQRVSRSCPHHHRHRHHHHPCCLLPCPGHCGPRCSPQWHARKGTNPTSFVYDMSSCSHVSFVRDKNLFVFSRVRFPVSQRGISSVFRSTTSTHHPSPITTLTHPRQTETPPQIAPTRAPPSPSRSRRRTRPRWRCRFPQSPKRGSKQRKHWGRPTPVARLS